VIRVFTPGAEGKDVMTAAGLWRSSRYPLRVESYDPARSEPIEVWIDVTGSAPPHDTPGKVLAGVFGDAIEVCGVKKRPLDVLDLGAGKLRNTLYFLGLGHNVDAVEYETSQQTPQGQAALQCARRFKKKNRFRRYVFPGEFVALDADYDLVLLINVINIMPVPCERLLVLLHCYRKLRPSGRLLWFTQYGDQAQNKLCMEAYRIGDGYFLGETNNYKTFFRQFVVPEIDSMMLGCGFALDRIVRGAHKNQARLYRRLPTAPLDGVLDERTIEEAALCDWTMAPPALPAVAVAADGPVRSPDDPELSLPKLLLRRLRDLPAGRDSATAYEYLAACLIEYLFRDHLVNLQLQETTYQGRERIDFVLTNSARSGLFKNLVDSHGLRVPYVHFECKNYGGDPKNTEFQQLRARLGGRKGEVGFILCRRVHDPRSVLARQQDALDDDKLVLVLTDDDLETLVDLKLNEDEGGIHDVLDDKVREVVLKKAAKRSRSRRSP